MRNIIDSPFVSIVIPCRNEEQFIGKCLDSIIANGYPKDRLEILVIDGMSEDKTREIIERYTQQYQFVRLLDNPKKIIPCALNVGIKGAKGGIIMRMDAHATYEKNYISKCVKYLSKYNADNVGGIWKIVPRGNTLLGKAIAIALSHPLGSGNAYYKVGGVNEPRWVDIVPFGCYRKEVFEKIGLLNEDLVNSEDMEFNSRLKRAKGKILLIPEIVSYYYARSDFKSFVKHNLRNGFWAIYPFKFTDHMPVSWRHLIPLAFVLSLMGSLGLWRLLSLLGSHGFLGLLSSLGLLSFLVIGSSYSLCNLFFSAKVALKEKDLRYLFVMPVIFAALHIGYGLGSVWGLIKCLGSKRFWRNLRGILREGSFVG